MRLRRTECPNLVRSVKRRIELSTQVELLNPILGAAAAVIAGTVDELPAKGQISLLNQSVTSQQVNVIVRGAGQISGIVMVGMSFITADRIASQMLDQAIKSFDQHAANAIAELVSRVGLQAKSLLQECGIACEFSSPAVIKGTRVELPDLCIPAIVVPLATSLGEIHLTVGLRKLAMTSAA